MSSLNAALDERLVHQTMASMFLATASARHSHMAIQSDNGRVSLTYGALLEEVQRLAAGLAAVGVRRGDAVALMMTNRPEFFPLDIGAQCLGATSFSLYNSAPASQLSHVLIDSGAKVVVCERRFLRELIEARRLGAAIERLIVIDGDGSDGAMTLDGLRMAGRSGFDLEAEVRLASPEDIATLVYTSGSTGNPKGVELTHANLVAEVRAIHAMVPQVVDGSYISFLPAAHIGDRARSLYGSVMAFGHTITTVADAKDLVPTMKQARPVYCGAPPRFWEKIRANLEAKYGPDLESRARLDPGIGEEVRTGLGLDRALWISTGAAPTQATQFPFFDSLGVRLCELWGMSETCSIATTNTPQDYRFGSVGRPVAGLEMKLAEDAELLVRGPTVARRYRGLPEITAESFDQDGWFHTGDIARVDSEGFWWIVDRKKDIMINAAGKNMSPTNIESTVKSSSPLIMQACVIGSGRPYNVALLVVDSTALGGVGADDLRVREQLNLAIEAANGQLSRPEQIKKFHALTQEWLPGGDELTLTMKLKRREIEQKYKAAIERLYASSEVPSNSQGE